MTRTESSDNGVAARGPADELLVEVDGPVRVVTLNRPDAYNATDEGLHGELATVWTELAADPDTRAIVLTGAGRAFSGGGDLGLLQRMTDDLELRDRIMAEATDIVRTMTAVPVPIVAAVNGPAVGLGCSLAAMSDLVVMEEQAYFADPHVSIGLVAADGGALTWPLLMSLLRAKEYLFLGERIPAQDALTLGLANRVVAAGEGLTSARELAHRLAALPPQAVQATKSLLNTSVRSLVEAGLAAAVADETASFDEPAFRANLERLAAKTTS